MNTNRIGSKLSKLVFIVLVTLTFKTVEAQSFQDAYTDFQKQNYGSASKKLNLLAQKDDPRAQALLGYMFLNGLGVAENGREAVKWYKKSADKGIAFAHSELGRMYWGGNSVPQDFSKAAHHFKSCAEISGTTDENGLCHSRTGFALMNGWFGKKDDEEAKRYFRTAFQLGNNDFMWMVLLSDMEGKETTSLMWANICAAFNKDCDGMKKNKIGKASDSQFRKAQKMSSECVESNFVKCDW